MANAFPTSTLNAAICRREDCCGSTPCTHPGSAPLSDELGRVRTLVAPPAESPLDELGPTRTAAERFELYGQHATRAATHDHTYGAAPETKTRLAVGEIMREAARTFEERNAIYGDNFKMVAPIVAIMFPGGPPSALVLTDKWHLFELLLVKLTRFAVSRLAHEDSIHDAAVYAAMVQALVRQELETFNKEIGA